MAKENDKEKCCPDRKWHHGHNGTMGWIYFLGIIGVAVYYIQQNSQFWMVILAILKAIVWPAFLLHEVFVRLTM